MRGQSSSNQLGLPVTEWFQIRDVLLIGGILAMANKNYFALMALLEEFGSIDLRYNALILLEISLSLSLRCHAIQSVCQILCEDNYKNLLQVHVLFCITFNKLYRIYIVIPITFN